jgi:hypothetical protein
MVRGFNADQTERETERQRDREGLKKEVWDNGCLRSLPKLSKMKIYSQPSFFGRTSSVTPISIFGDEAVILIGVTGQNSSNE